MQHSLIEFVSRNYLVVVLRFLEDVKGSLVEAVVDLNIDDRVGDEGKTLRGSDLSTDVRNKVKGSEPVEENRDIIDG
jgi:hypothetical protein